MDFDVSVNVSTVPTLEVKGFEDLEKQVGELVEEMKNVEVNEENIKGSKKLIAEVRKKYDTLDSERKRVKSELLAPYQVLENQLKDLKKVLDEGDESIRTQIKELELKAKEERKKELKLVFEEYYDYYELPFGVEFDSVLESNLLNKSVSGKRAKEGIIAKMEKLANSVNFIELMVTDVVERAQVLEQWLSNGFNAELAVSKWKARTDLENKLMEQQLQKDEKPAIVIQPTILEKKVSEESSTLVIYGSDNVHEVVNFMIKNKIQFKQI